MPTSSDYYELLGVPRDADSARIKKAFRDLARKYHPDRNKEPEAEQRFKDIAQAYAVLSDPEQRAQYDAGALSGTQSFSPEDVFHRAGLDDMFGGLGLGDSWFDRMFGRQRRQHPERGEDLQARLDVSLEKILTGGNEELTLSRPERCKDCHGSGAKEGTSPRRCPDCHGSGQLVASSMRGTMQVRSITHCKTCAGKGQLIDQPCATCEGLGQVVRERHLTVRIPAGVLEGTVLRLLGQGLPGPPGGAPGDLHLIVRGAVHPRFERDGNDLWGRLPLDVLDATLGTTVTLPTLDGNASVKVPAGAQPDSVLRLKGKGLPSVDSPSRGDLLLRVQIRVPEALSSDERALFERLRELRLSASTEASRATVNGSP